MCELGLLRARHACNWQVFETGVNEAFVKDAKTPELKGPQFIAAFSRFDIPYTLK